LAAVVAICLVGGTITSISAAQASNRKPPPVPQCYYTGSGYGLCEGYVIPAPGSVVKLIYPNKKGVFELTGPTPLQWTRQVACGDLGCVYNHLDWSVGGGTRIVSGCGVEQSTCNVKVGAFYSWVPVYVRQNNNPATLYLIWDSTKVGAFIHGFVRDKKQNNVGVEDVVITAYGTGRTQGSPSDVTGTEGFYEVNVRPGTYKVVPSGGPSGTASPKYNPTSRDVKLGPGGIVTANFDRSALELSSTAVDCVAGDTETAPQNCTVTVSDATAAPPLLAPTGSVDLSATSGKLSVASCTLAANSATAAGTCTFHYTLPTEDAELLKTPTITATYQGDKVFAKSSGKKLFSCNAAVLLRVTSISSSAPSTNGFRTNAPVTLQGCGFKASAVVRFGADNATARPEPSNVAADGSTMTLTVPDLAITGPLTVTEGKSTATLANPKPVKIDSWRNTNGLSFVNFGGSITPKEFLAEFPTSGLTTPNTPAGSDVLAPWAALRLSMLQKAVPKGVCFGIALASGEFAEGLLRADYFEGDSKIAYDVPPTPGFKEFLTEQWMAQASDQFYPYILEGHTFTNGASITSALDAAMGGADGWTTPAIISIKSFDTKSNMWDAHAEVAYGWAQSPVSQHPDRMVINTSDSNYPFSPSEGLDETGETHAKRLELSRIYFLANGSWVAEVGSGGALYGDAKNMEIAPVSALQGKLALSRSSTFNIPDSVTLAGNDRVEEVENAAGAQLNLTEDTPDLTIVPQLSTTPSSSSKPATAAGVGGIAELLTSSKGPLAVTLNGGGGPVAALFEQGLEEAEVSTGSGHLKATFDPAGNAVAVAPAKNETGPRSATITVDTDFYGGTVERVLSVRGPADAKVSLGSRAQVVSPTGGTFAVTLSEEGNRVPAASAELGTIKLKPGETLSVAPKQWSHLATTPLRTALTTAKGKVTHPKLRGVKLPTARVKKMTYKNRKLKVTVRVPQLTVGQASVTVSVAVVAKYRTIAQGKAMVAAGGPAHTSVVVVQLGRFTPQPSRVVVTVTTINGGTAPSETTSKFTE
jgi:hypothetical protein